MSVSASQPVSASAGPRPSAGTSSSQSTGVPATVSAEDRATYLALLRIYGSASAALAALRAMKAREGLLA